jgi:Abortive infection C-terminus
MVDTLGLLLTVLVHPADIQDRDGGKLLVEQIKCALPRLKVVFADDVPDSAKAADTIRRLLGNLGSITQSLAELRNAYGTGHGHDGRAKGLSPRHARLAAGAACTLAKFLFETHQHRSD